MCPIAPECIRFRLFCVSLILGISSMTLLILYFAIHVLSGGSLDMEAVLLGFILFSLFLFIGISIVIWLNTMACIGFSQSFRAFAAMFAMVCFAAAGFFAVETLCVALKVYFG